VLRDFFMGDERESGALPNWGRLTAE